MIEPQPSQQALRASEARFRGAFDHSPIGMGIVDLDGQFVRVNPALCRIGGYSESELLSRSFQDVVPADELDFHRSQVRRLLHGEIDSYEREVRYRHKLGHFVWVRFAVSAIRGSDGRVVHLLGQAEDISARREAERRLRQAERLEALGRLAGGVAHEFNNLLAVIGGFARHALERADAQPLRRDLSEIVDAAERAAETSRQLLAFSRDEPSRPTLLDANELIGAMEPMLRRVIREDVEVFVAARDGLPAIRADRAQLQRAILNLVLNARDAIPGEGRIEIAARQVEVEDVSPTRQLDRGSYVALSVSDTGTGIDADARERLFDPFFTTKEQGAGTGLGLSIVYGLVEELGGAVVVDSEPGQGSTFTMFIPAVTGESPPEARAGEPTGAPARRGGETILVVEDEAALRSLIELLLEEAGYRVLTAGDGEEALVIVRREGSSKIDLVLTDSIMPRLSGSELVERLRSLDPGPRVIQMTGYSDRDFDGDFIAKPFEPETLLDRVREALDRAA